MLEFGDIFLNSCHVWSAHASGRWCSTINSVNKASARITQVLTLGKKMLNFAHCRITAFNLGSMFSCSNMFINITYSAVTNTEVAHYYTITSTDAKHTSKKPAHQSAK